MAKKRTRSRSPRSSAPPEGADAGAAPSAEPPSPDPIASPAAPLPAWRDPVFVVALALSLVVRLWLLLHPSGSLSFAEHVALEKSWNFWHWGRPGLDLDPHTAGWPGLSFYLAFASQLVLRGVGSLLGVYRAPGDFEVTYVLHHGWLLASAQLMWTALAVLGLIAAYGWSSRAAGLGAARFTALGLALDPLRLEESLTIGPDIPAATFTWLALWLLLRYEQERRPRDLWVAAACCGLGASAKYYPAGLGLAFLWTLWRMQPDAGGSRRFPWARALACLGLAVAVFLATSPTLLTDWAVTRRDVGLQISALGMQRFGQDWRGPGWLYYLLNVLPQDLGWPILILALAGLVGLLWKRPQSRPGAVTMLIILALLSELGTVYPRYFLPGLPLLWAGAGWLLLRAFPGWLSPRMRQAAAAAVLAAWVALRVGPAVALMMQSDSRALAARDLKSTLRPGADVLREYYTPDLPTLPQARRAQDLRAIGGLSARFAAEADSLFYARQLSLYLSSVSPEESDLFYDPRYLRAVDGVLVSSTVSDRYRAQPQRFPRQLAFYAHLQRYARHVRHWGGPGRAGPVIDLYLPDSTRFDSLAASWERAEQHFPPARTGAPAEKEAAFHGSLGALYLDHDRAALAVPELERAVALDPRSPAAYDNLALALTQTGQPERAREVLLRSLQVRPDDPNTELDLMALETSMGHFDGLMARIVRLAQSPDVPQEGLFELGRTLEQSGRPVEAATAYQAVATRTRGAAAYLSLGRVQEQLGFMEGAVDAYLSALEAPAPLPEAGPRARALLSRLEPSARARAEARLKALGGSGPGGAAR